jgi:GTPase SAR1 family protein
MFYRPGKSLNERIESLRNHIANENPLLVDVIYNFQQLDKVAYRLGLMGREESYATKIAWWPMVSILGTFSSGKSTFINHYVGHKLQKTGNQAVDDKFTVICYTQDEEPRVLPGLALDADPRFPFFQISEEIEKVASGEGSRVDTYLQLKTCPSEALQGKILIDSPGFDADQQRNSTLRITNHIIDLSDLVLVFFDARHPEPGAMQDTLEHLVAGTLRRNDSNKVLFILNQIDTTAQEDNVEDVIAAWQRALAQYGLASGRFYAIYNDAVAMPMEDENLRRRYESHRDTDMEEINQRISEVSVERVYRIIGALEHTANRIEHKIVPQLRDALKTWSKRVMLVDALILVPLILVLLILTINAGYWQGLRFSPPWLGILGSPTVDWIVLAVLIVLGMGSIHIWVRNIVAKYLARGLPKDKKSGDLARAFLGNTRYWRSIFQQRPLGWNRFSKKRVAQCREAADHFVQILNDQYTHPSGEADKPESKPVVVENAPNSEQPLAKEGLRTSN